MTNAIGWLSAIALMATLSSQVFIQWNDKNWRGVSPWLFSGQLASSIGFIIYSALLGNAIFVVTNSLIAMVAVLGEVVYLRNRNFASSKKSGARR